MKKGDVGMVKRFSKTYGNSTKCNPKVMSKCLSAPEATSLHHCLENKQLKPIRSK